MQTLKNWPLQTLVLLLVRRPSPSKSRLGKDVCGNEERYRGKLLSGDGKAWLEEVLVERRWHDESAGADGRTPEAHLRDMERRTDRSPYANANFLKNSYLQACKSAGLFEPIVKGSAASALHPSHKLEKLDKNRCSK